MAQPISTSERAPLRTKAELHVAKRLRELRSAAGVSQAWVANAVGISGAQINGYEAGRTKVTVDRLAQIADAFGINVEWFSANDAIPEDWTSPFKPETADDKSTPILSTGLKELGDWLKAQRETAGLSQRDLAARVEVTYYSFISHTEIGRSRIPLGRLHVWADALQIDRRKFAEKVLRFYEPELHATLCGVAD